MSQVKIQITAQVIKTLNKEDWQDEWQEYCEDELGEEGDTGEPSDEFVLASYTDALENGELGLFEELEEAIIDVRKVP